MAGINVTKLKDIQVLLPPLDMQRRFERVIDYHSKVLNRYFTCAQRTDDLFQSLVARGFRGELTSSATDEILQQAVVS
jgi:type I restriction enzyme S subunit